MNWSRKIAAYSTLLALAGVLGPKNAQAGGVCTGIRIDLINTYDGGDYKKPIPEHARPKDEVKKAQIPQRILVIKPRKIYAGLQKFFNNPFKKAQLAQANMELADSVLPMDQFRTASPTSFVTVTGMMCQGSSSPVGKSLYAVRASDAPVINTQLALSSCASSPALLARRGSAPARP